MVNDFDWYAMNLSSIINDGRVLNKEWAMISYNDSALSRDKVKFYDDRRFTAEMTRD